MALKLQMLMGFAFSILSNHVVAHISVNVNAHCHHLVQLGGGKKPGYLAVIAHNDEDITWVSQLPLPSIVYNLNLNSTIAMSPLQTPSAVFIQFMIEYYECLPPWTLFLIARGRNSYNGGGMSRGGSGLVTHGLQGFGGAFTLAAANKDVSAYHTMPPAISSALLDVVSIDRGFIGVNHLSESEMHHIAHPAAIGFSVHAPVGSHSMAFISEEEKKRGCACSTLHAFFPQQEEKKNWACERSWAWPLGGEFWASSKRINNRPIEFWENALTVLTTGKKITVELESSQNQIKENDITMKNKGNKQKKSLFSSNSLNQNSKQSEMNDDMLVPFPTSKTARTTVIPQHFSNNRKDDGIDLQFKQNNNIQEKKETSIISDTEMRGRCFESLWHAALGEPLYHYQPLYEYFEAMPIISFQSRCVEGRKRLSRSCRYLKIPQPISIIKSSMMINSKDEISSHNQNNLKCIALHGDMLGKDVMVTTYAGTNLEDADHSCCKKCRQLPQCTFWVRATNSRECWLKTAFIGYGTQSNRRGMFISEFNGVFLNEL